VAVRPARARDLDRLAALFGLLVADQSALDPGFAIQTDAGDAPWRALLAQRLGHADGGVWMAAPLRARGRVGPVGLCVAAVARRSPPFRETQRGELEHLFVREEWRRQGVGRALGQAALDWLVGCGVSRAAVQVARGNAAGRCFWAALGFRSAMDVLERRL